MVKLGFVEFAAIVLAAAVLSPGVMAQPPSDTGTVTLYQGAYSYALDAVGYPDADIVEVIREGNEKRI